MSCEEIFRHMGFSCRQISDRNYRVFTPLTFSGGEPIGWYLSESDGGVIISDNADTLFHLSSVGMDLSDRKKWKGVRGIADSFGISLEDSGEILGKSQTKSVSHLISRYLGAMLAIRDLENESAGEVTEPASFVDEVGGHLRLWKPAEQFLIRPKAIGHSGRTHQFDFRLGAEFVEAARPHSGRTGSILRKATDVRNTSEAPSILVVMDDRMEPGKAKDEADILTSLVRVLPFTRLMNNLSGAPEVRH